MEKQEKGMKKWIYLDCIRNTAFSSILFVNKNTDSLKAAEQQQICWGKNEPMKKISGFKLKILLKGKASYLIKPFGKSMKQETVEDLK